MRKYLHIVMLMALLLSGCTARESVGVPEPENPVGQPVLFTSGSMSGQATKTDNGVSAPWYYGMSETGGVPYMPLDGRFVCTMYYHAAAGDTDNSPFDILPPSLGGTATTAWLKVNDNVGNSVFRLPDYDESAMDLDTYKFDRHATVFFWRNRLTHAFLALADYNQLTSNDGATTTQGKLKMYPNHDKDLVTLPEEPDNILSDGRYANTYDLTRGERTSMAQQPDPILALTIMKPAGATQEANRVRLYFRHQFAQIQVNIKGSADNSADILADQIEKVELLGVSEEGYVSCRLNADGTLTPASAKDVKLDAYTDAELIANPWGTSMEMFVAAEAALGYLKTFEAIAFGQLRAIRITWHEGTAETPGIKHVTTYEVPLTNETDNESTDDDNKKPVIELRNLHSGMKYIYNLELRRGTLAVIRTEILPWMQREELVYGTDGTIYN